MDYRELLKKYLTIVMGEEGTIFLGNAALKKEEYKELKKLYKEAE